MQYVGCWIVICAVSVYSLAGFFVPGWLGFCCVVNVSLGFLTNGTYWLLRLRGQCIFILMMEMYSINESRRFFPSIQIPLFYWVKVEWNVLKLSVWTKVESSFYWSVLGLQCPRNLSKTLPKLSIRTWIHPLIMSFLCNLFFFSWYQ